MTKKGFTLVETLIAVSIITLALIPPLYTAYQSIISANFARDQMIANYLAQDAMDYIIGKKNQNIYACTNEREDSASASDDDKDCDKPNPDDGAFGRFWLADLDACNTSVTPADPSRKCHVDTTRTCNYDPGTGTCTQPFTYEYVACSGSDLSCYLVFDRQRNMYRPYVVTTGVPAEYKTVTKFKRYASITTLGGQDAPEAQVTVTVSWKSSGITSDDSLTIRSNIYRILPQ